ncbi:MAG: alpha/beta hydrolase, partial [Acidimicrobiia bacterium]
TVMRDHPAGVRSVILDSTYPIAADIMSESPANLNRALGTLFSACANDQACRTTYPDLEARLFRLIDQLDADPVGFTARDFLSGEQYDVLLDGTGLLGTVFQGLYSEDVFPQLPQLIEDLEVGDTVIASLLTSNDIVNAQFFSFGMHLSVQCREEVPFTSAAAIDAGLEPYPRLTDLFDESINLSTPVFEVCDLWQSGTADPLENAPVESDIPTLVMAGSFDPITPPDWGLQVATSLDNSAFVEFPTLGHGTSVAGECPVEIALEFVNDPGAEPATGCIRSMDPVPFVIAPFDVSAIRLEAFREDVFGTMLSGVVPEGWESIGDGAWTRGETALDQTSIVQQPLPPGLDEGFVLGLYEDQLGVIDSLAFQGEVASPSFTWRLFSGDIDGFVVDVALANRSDVTGLILMVSEPEERDDLFGAVFQPALDAFETT